MKSEEMNHLQTSTKPKKKVGMILFDRIILAIENKTTALPMNKHY